MGSGDGTLTPDEALDTRLRAALAELTLDEPTVNEPTVSGWEQVGAADAAAGWWWQLFEAQLRSRELDLAARRLQRAGRGFYTIASAGHESNALVALALRPTDPALLHYRSGGFYCGRAAQVPGSTPVRDVLQGLIGAADEPIAGGRHKVFGHPDLAIIPQTSTIASQLPRAVGLAMAIPRAARLAVECEWPSDSVVVCSFGDASANHSTAAGAINTSVNAAFRGLPVPLLLVCEDNGLGISVPTPTGWIEAAYGSRPGLEYLTCDGSDPERAWPTIVRAVEIARTQRRPVFLRLRTVRYLGHAGSDAEVAYRSPSEIAADLAADPIIGTGRALLARGATKPDLLKLVEEVAAEVAATAAELTGARPLESAMEIMVPLAPRHPDRVAAQAAQSTGSIDRSGNGRPGRGFHSGTQPVGEPALPTAQASSPRRTLAESINATLAELLATDPRVIVFGEDVGTKGGVYGVTRGLTKRFGRARVFDSILDEQSILGLGLGAGLAGLLPIPEIQYLAYLHNAEDQLRGEAASLAFFSQGRYRNPMVIRIAGLAYQKGFGGHFHNDNAVAVLRDIPGLVVACPSRGDDAAAMLRTCVAAATVDGTVSVFLEPIALYHTRDLHAAGDSGWLFADSDEPAPIGSTRAYGPEHADLTIITFGNGVPMSLRVAARLQTSAGISARVCDLRWLAPLPIGELAAEAERTGRVLVADETRQSGGVGEGIVAGLVEHGFTGPIRRVTSRDCFVPLGNAANLVLLSEAEIEQAALAVAGMDAR